SSSKISVNDSRRGGVRAGGESACLLGRSCIALPASSNLPAHPPALPAAPAPPALLQLRPHVLEIDRLLVDAAARRGDVVGELARLVHRLVHDAEEVFG